MVKNPPANAGGTRDMGSIPGSEDPLEKEMATQPVHPKGDQSWVFIGRTDVEAETSVLWAPDAKS